MVAFNEEQKKIALLLLNEPKTEEELHKQLNIPYDKLTIDLKNMLKLGLVSKDGYPTKYKLKQEIISEVQKRKKIAEDDSFRLRISAIIEIKAIEEDLLKKQSKKIMEAIGKEENFTIYGITQAEIEENKDEEMFATFIEVNMSVRDLPTLIRFLFYYGPTTLEVLKPTKVEFSNYEFQEGMMQLTDIFQKYSTYLEKNINKNEMDKFYKNLYK